jgi:hypothetical protein
VFGRLSRLLGVGLVLRRHRHRHGPVDALQVTARHPAHADGGAGHRQQHGELDDKRRTLFGLDLFDICHGAALLA